MERVRRIEIYRVRLMLREALHHAQVRVDCLDELFAVLLTDGGVTGRGEVRGNGAYATGADVDLVVEALSRCGKELIGLSLNELAPLALAATGLPLAAALLEGAALDAAAAAAGVPVWRWLGAPAARPLSTHAHIGFVSPRRAGELARLAIARGVRRIKIRVGSPSLDDDLARVSAVRETVGSAVELALDANGAWSADVAVEALTALAAFGVLWIEQPTAPGDDPALAKVRARSPVPVIVDESVRGAADVHRVARCGLADGVHLKLEKCGTFAALQQAVEAARAERLLIELGQMDMGRLGCALTAHLATALPVDYCELWGFQHICRDVASGLEMDQGHIKLSNTPGLGVEVDLGEAERVLSIC